MKKTILILFGLCCLMIGIVFLLFNFVLYPKKYQDYVKIYSAEFDLSPSLVFAIIKAESNFNEKAISSSGALGLMQLLPSTAKWISGEFNEDFVQDDLFNANINIKFGCFYLRYLMNKFNDIDTVICAYNAGEGAVKSWLNDNGKVIEENITYNETKNYLKKVKSYYQVYSTDIIFL